MVRFRRSVYDFDTGNLVREIEIILGDLISKCPEFATLTKGPDPWPDPEAVLSVVELRVTPANPNAATISILAADHADGVDLYVGEDTHMELEVPLNGWRSVGKSFREELSLICDAVVKVGFEETLWVLNGHTIKSEGKLRVGSETITPSRSVVFPELEKAGKKVIRYEPYC